MRSTREVTKKSLTRASPLVLLVQNDPGRLEILRFVLEDAGFFVHGAPSLTRALSDLRGGLRPGVVLLDLPENGVGGAAFALAARVLPTLSDLPVIVITTAAEARSLGGTTSFLIKPFRAIELVEALRAHGVPTREHHRAKGA